VVITLAVLCAGALGAPARHLLERRITARSGPGFPWGTAVVNLLGCFLLGALVGAVEFHGWADDVRVMLGIGFLGAFTTFSAFATEADRLPGARALGYVLLSVLGGVALAAAGLAVASL
jgi:CrcB protein